MQSSYPTVADVAESLQLLWKRGHVAFVQITGGRTSSDVDAARLATALKETEREAMEGQLQNFADEWRNAHPCDKRQWLTLWIVRAFQRHDY